MKLGMEKTYPLYTRIGWGSSSLPLLIGQVLRRLCDFQASEIIMSEWFG
jgi:hypothetical protein